MTIRQRVTLRRERRIPPAKAKGRRQLPAGAPRSSALISAPTAPGNDPTQDRYWRLAFAGLVLGCGIWSYFPTLATLADTWIRVTDYAHGFFVIPFAVCLLLLRRDQYPGLRSASPVLCLGLMGFSLALRHAGDAFFFTFLDAWSLLPWLAALAAIVGGWPLLRWCLPSIVFLFFMIPLPFSIEYDLSGPLQSIATTMSTATLQLVGQPAFAEGNVILLDGERFEVAQACSGLRLFMGILALTFAYVAVIRRPWWEKLILVSAAAPVAIISNAARIVATALLFQLTTNSLAREWIHMGAGWGMVAFAAALFWMLLWYIRQLIKEERVMDMAAVVRQCQI